MREGMARIVSFDLTADDDEVRGWGSAATVFELFVEPAAKAAEVAGALRIALEEERPIAMTTVLDSTVPVSSRATGLRPPRRLDRGALGDEQLSAGARNAALELLADERSDIRTLAGAKGEARAFVEVLEPLRLVICGPVTTQRRSPTRPRRSAGVRWSSTTARSS